MRLNAFLSKTLPQIPLREQSCPCGWMIEGLFCSVVRLLALWLQTTGMHVIKNWVNLFEFLNLLFPFEPFVPQ